MKVAAMSAQPKGKPVVLDEGREDKELVLLLRALRESIDESGEKHDAVARAMGFKDPAYLSKILSREKPLSARHLVSLPDKVETIFARKRAEYFGLIVVEPVHGDQAVRNLVSGLVGMLQQSLPARADHMAKATLTPATNAKAVGE